MKKRLLLITGLLTLGCSLAGCQPSAEKILERAYDKCQSIENGYYETTKYIQQIASTDTIVVEQTGYFKKLDNDDIYTFMFHSHFRVPSFNAHVSLLYTGDEIVEYSTNNRPIITPKRDRELEIRNTFVKNPLYNSFGPITNRDSYPLPSRELLASGTITMEFISEESVNGRECYRIRIEFDPSYDNTTVKQLVSKLEYDFWIDKKEYLPLQFTLSRDLTLDAEVVNMYEQQTLNKYDFNSVDHTMLTLQSLPSEGTIYEPPAKEPKELLPLGSLAPNWEMLSITGERHSLQDFKGDFVLLEFTTMACPACIQIIPQLTYLHDKYKDQGLQVIAAYTYVRNNDDMPNYINKYNIGYTVLIDSDDISRQYNVSGFPTTYLIDRDGKIVFQYPAKYNEAAIKEMESIIESGLAN